MEALDIRVKTLEKRMEKVEESIKDLNKHDIEEDKNKIIQHQELRGLITEAVQTGVNPILTKINQLDVRITNIENKEKEQALVEKLEREKENKTIMKDVKKTIVTVVITIFVTLIVNNLIAILTS